MNESSRPVALVALAVCGAGLGATVYLGTTPGPSRAGSASSVSALDHATASTPVSPSVPPASATATPALDPNAAPTGFVPSPNLTPEEQTALERLNELRANPPAFLPHWRKVLADTMKYGQCEEPPTMLDDLASYPARQPLAANQAMTDAARKHSADQIARSYQAHVSPDGIGPNKRVMDAGYPLPVHSVIGGQYGYDKAPDASNIESVASMGVMPPRPWTGLDWANLIDQLVVDACVPTRGHRMHVLSRDGISPYELEVGIGAAAGEQQKDGKPYGRQFLTIEIATRNNNLRFVVGVAYRDKNGNKRYDHGEGAPDIEVKLGAVRTKTAPGGGYVLPVMKDTKGTVEAAGATFPVDVKDENVKIDITVS